MSASIILLIGTAFEGFTASKLFDKQSFLFFRVGGTQSHPGLESGLNRYWFFDKDVGYRRELGREYSSEPSVQPTFQKMDTASLLAGAIKNGSGDEQGIRRDVGAVLAWLNAKKPADVSDLINAARQKLDSDNQSLSLLNEVEASYKQLNPNASFGPVSASTPGAAERLALLVRISNEVSRPGEIYRGVDTFAKSSGITSKVFDVAKQVQLMLGANETNGGLFWRDEVIPAILQSEWNNSQLIAAVTGSDLPSEWRNAEEWLKPWAVQRSLAISAGASASVDTFGFTRPRRAGYRPVAAHPLVLRILRDRVTNSQSSSDTRQFLTWLAGIAGSEPETAFSAGIFVLNIATLNKVRVGDAGGKGDLEGDAYWVGLARQVADLIINLSDAGENVPESWQVKQGRLDELYQNCRLCQRPMLGRETLGEALILYGQVRMRSVWDTFNTETQKRATEVGGADAQKIKELAEKAKQSHSLLAALMGNPFCAPWLAKATQLNPPKSLEAGVLLRWHMSRLIPRDLERALTNGFLVAALDSSERKSAKEKLSSLDNFAPWETLRGAWAGKVAQEAPPDTRERSPWKEISETSLIGSYKYRISNWLSNPSASLSETEIPASLAVLCWMGPPSQVDLSGSIKRAIDSIDNENDKAKTFLRACRLHLAVSSALRGEALGQVLNDNQLLEAPEIANLHQSVEQLNNSGHPFAIRAATEITWLVGKRTISIQSPKLSESGATATPTSAGPGAPADARSAQLRELSRNMLQKLDPLLSEAVTTARTGGGQSGLGLALVDLEIDLYRSLPDTAAATPRRQRKEAFINLAGDGITAGSVGSGFWGLDAWFGQWERELDNLRESRLLTIKPVAFRLPKLRESTNRTVGGLMAILCGTSTPSLTAPTVASTSAPQSSNTGVSWQDLGLWSVYLNNDRTLTNNAADLKRPLNPAPSAVGMLATNVRLSSVPWAEAAQPAGMIKGLTDRGFSLETTTRKLTEMVDADGLNDRYLPLRTWIAGIGELDTAAQDLENIESRIREQHNALRLEGAIHSLKPLLSAPLVVNLSAFRDELAAAVAEVRKAEFLLNARRSDSLAAKLEVQAQDLLTQVFKLEKERTDNLIKISENEAEIQRIGSEIARQHIRLADLKKEQEKNKVEIAELEEKIRQNEEKKREIEVGMAASVVATLKNQLELLQNLIYKPTDNPGAGPGEPKQLPGQLGVIAFQAQKQVNAQLEELRKRRGDLERQLNDLREASFFKAVTTFIGAVVGCVIGGPAGIQMGAMIGQAVGGVIAGIKQGKPFKEVFGSTLQSGIKIAAASGVNLETKAGGGSFKGGEMIETLREAQKVLGPLLKDLPAFLDKKNLQEALTVSGADNALRTLIDGIRKDSLARLESLGVPSSAGEFVKGVDELLLTGTPEEIHTRLGQLFLESLERNQDISELRKAAAELGVVIEGTVDDHLLKKKIAEKVATLGVVRLIPRLTAQRDQMLQRLLISLTTLQDVLKKNNVTNLDGAINSMIAQGISRAEYQPQIRWISTALKDLPLTLNQEIAWSQLKPKLREALIDMFPGDPERRELVLGQMQAQLDTDGMQAEVQRVLNPWNQELQRRMSAVDQALAQPCTQDDDEERLECHIRVVDDGAGKLQGDVLNWLKSANTPEYAALRDEVSKKIEKLDIAIQHLDIKKLDWKQAGDALKQAGFLKANAELDVEIAKLGVSVATLASQQADIALQNAGLEVRRTKLKSEQDVLNELISETRANALRDHQRASEALVSEAEANLDSAAARARAARNRAVVFGKVEGWYANVQPAQEDQVLADLSALISEHKSKVEDAGIVIRDLLRILRVSGGNADPMALPKPQETWSARLKAISKELNDRYKALKLPEVLWFETDLTPEQIEQLFPPQGAPPESGLDIFIEQYDPFKLDTVRRNKTNPNWYPVPPRALYERVFFTFIRGEDENGVPVNQDWARSTSEHEPFAPVLQRKGASEERVYLLTAKRVPSNLPQWDFPISEQITLNKVYSQIKATLGIGDAAGAFDNKLLQNRVGMPFTGGYHFRVEGRRPKRAKLVLVYVSYPQN